MMHLAPSRPALSRLIPSTNSCVNAAVVAGLVGLELTGRFAASDLFDAVAAALLALAVVAVVSRHRRRPLPWMSRALDGLKKLSRSVDRWKYDYGLDLRGSPAIPQKLPPAVAGISLVLIAWGGVAVLTWYVFPDGWRGPAATACYLATLVGTMLLWAGLIACVAVGLLAPLVATGGKSKPLLVVFYGLTVIAVAALAPLAVTVGLGLFVALAAAAFAARSAASAPAFVWRENAKAPLYSVPLPRLVAGSVSLAALLVVDLILTACGGRLLGGHDLPEAMPLTVLLGSIAGWLLPGAAIAALVGLRVAQKIDPSRTTPPTVHLAASATTADDEFAARLQLANHGWNVRSFGSSPQVGDVCIQIVPADQSQATEFEPQWPLKVSLVDLDNPRVRERLLRRDEIQVRRQIVRGLDAIFKRALPERGRRGGGYWFGPHWWFIGNLEREDPARGKSARHGSTLRSVGPTFAEAIGPRGRQHLYRVLRAVKVDMIYLEDGVTVRHLVKVLRAIFELYDVHGGKRRAEDHYFRGLPKVRVMIHDYAPGSKFRATGYRQPQFDDLSRARVLHVFKDTGEHEEPWDAPTDWSWEPAPSLGCG